MRRTWAIVERELRRFRRSPMLIIVSMVFPMVQLVVLGYAFGGAVKNLKLGIVDRDGHLAAVKLRELFGAVAANAGTFETVNYNDPGQAMTDVRNGRINGVVTIPPEFSRRALAKNEPRIALIADNADNFVAATMAATLYLGFSGGHCRGLGEGLTQDLPQLRPSPGALRAPSLFQARGINLFPAIHLVAASDGMLS